MDIIPTDLVSEKIAKLADVSENSSLAFPNKKAFFVNDNEFVVVDGNLDVLLRLDGRYEEKFVDALNADPRASFEHAPKGWIRLKMKSEIDIEFVFLYIRNTWKFFKSQ